jgi:SnoaL-like domain
VKSLAALALCVPLAVATAPAKAAVDNAAELAQIQKGLDGLGLKIERLEGRNQVEKIQRAYGYYVDKSQWPAIVDMFTKDATYEIGGRGVFIGPDRALAYLHRLGGVGIGSNYGGMYDHQQFQGVVHVSEDGTHAWARWTAFVMAAGRGSAVWGDCIYENEYVKEDGVWKIKTIHAPFMMYTNFGDSWKNFATTNTTPADRATIPPDLPPTVVYLTYPSFYVPRYHYPNPVTGMPMPEPNPAAGGVAPMKPVARN